MKKIRSVVVLILLVFVTNSLFSQKDDCAIYETVIYTLDGRFNKAYDIPTEVFDTAKGIKYGGYYFLVQNNRRIINTNSNIFSSNFPSVISDSLIENFSIETGDIDTMTDCSFKDVNYQFVSFYHIRDMVKFRPLIVLENSEFTKYTPYGLAFSNVIYLDKYAMLYVRMNRNGRFLTSLTYLFEYIDGKWVIIDQIFNT